MPKRIEGVSTRLLACAKQEFLEKGFIGASIRSIAQKAETSPRAIYTRFPDKEGLFEAIVGKTITDFMKMFEDGFSYYWKDKSFEVKPIFDISSADGYITLIDFAYDHIDEFILVLKCSDGTKYSDFTKQLAKINFGYFEVSELKKENPTEEKVTSKLFEVLNHSFYSTLFEPVLENMTRAEARLYATKLFEFFMTGTQVRS